MFNGRADLASIPVLRELECCWKVGTAGGLLTKSSVEERNRLEVPAVAPQLDAQSAVLRMRMSLDYGGSHAPERSKCKRILQSTGQGRCQLSNVIGINDLMSSFPWTGVALAHFKSRASASFATPAYRLDDTPIRRGQALNTPAAPRGRRPRGSIRQRRKAASPPPRLRSWSRPAARSRAARRRAAGQPGSPPPILKAPDAETD